MGCHISIAFLISTFKEPKNIFNNIKFKILPASKSHYRALLITTIVIFIMIDSSMYWTLTVSSFGTPTSPFCNVKMPRAYSVCHKIWCLSFSLRLLLPLFSCQDFGLSLLASSMSPSLLVSCSLSSNKHKSLFKKKIRWPNCPFILLSYYLSPSFPCQAVSICCLYCFIIHLPLRLLPSAFSPTTLLFHSPKYALFKVNVDWFFSCFSRSSSNCFYNNNHLFIFFLLSLLIA